MRYMCFDSELGNSIITDKRFNMCEIFNHEPVE